MLPRCERDHYGFLRLPSGALYAAGGSENQIAGAGEALTSPPTAIYLHSCRKQFI
jgi:hypothetical protein